MSVTSDTQPVRAARPWSGLPPEAYTLLRDNQQQINEEIISTIAREVPPYAKPLEGAFGDNVRRGVAEALQQFGEMIQNPNYERANARAIYVGLGRLELRSGRSIGALLAAYRVGAQVAWRRLAAAGLTAGVAQETLNLLAESIFAYIDELSAESAEGYALEQAEIAGVTDRRRAELIELIVRDTPPADDRELTRAAERAGWRIPREIAVLAWDEELGRRPAARLSQDSIAAMVGDCFAAIVSDPDGPGRQAELSRSLRGMSVGMGVTVTAMDGARSFHSALAALRLGVERDTRGLTRAGEHRVELLCRSDPVLVADIESRRLGSLANETPGSQQRLRETLLAWLRRDGDIRAAAEDLHVHAQTLRYRLARLRELLGDQLDDPDARFELEFALRSRA